MATLAVAATLDGWTDTMRRLQVAAEKSHGNTRFTPDLHLIQT
jgi:hypothetical protein